MSKNVLVTGGAGYIGAHIMLALNDAGYKVIALDDLSTGVAENVVSGELIHGDMADAALLHKVFTTHAINAVIHCAALVDVAESMQQPERYYEANVSKTIVLLNAMVAHQVNTIIFSSTAAIFGEPDYIPIDEHHPKNPTSVYGEIKLEAEHLLAEFEAKHGIRYGCLRYFNAAGFDVTSRLPIYKPSSTHLIPKAFHAVQQQIPLNVYGTDYDTSDGTCIRDYVHVSDLADAHLLLLEYLARDGKERHFNLGTGKGYSVKEVIAMVESLTGKTVEIIIEPRRKGDSATLIADGSKAHNILKWQPKYPEIRMIIQHAWDAMIK